MPCSSSKINAVLLSHKELITFIQQLCKYLAITIREKLNQSRT